jgi:hypothetical protein
VDGDLRKIFRENLREAQWTSIESAITAAGIPDAEYCFAQGKSGWIEFKKTDTVRIHHLKKMQVAWMERRARLGGRAFVAIRCGDKLWLYDAASSRSLVENGLVSSSLGAWDGGPSQWNWRAIKDLLTR